MVHAGLELEAEAISGWSGVNIFHEVAQGIRTHRTDCVCGLDLPWCGSRKRAGTDAEHPTVVEALQPFGERFPAIDRLFASARREKRQANDNGNQDNNTAKDYSPCFKLRNRHTEARLFHCASGNKSYLQN